MFEYIDYKIINNKNNIFGLPKFKASHIFKKSDDCNISLIHAYVWVLKNAEVDI